MAFPGSAAVANTRAALLPAAATWQHVSVTSASSSTRIAPASFTTALSFRRDRRGSCSRGGLENHIRPLSLRRRRGVCVRADGGTTTTGTNGVTTSGSSGWVERREEEIAAVSGKRCHFRWFFRIPPVPRFSRRLEEMKAPLNHGPGGNESLSLPVSYPPPSPFPSTPLTPPLVDELKALLLATMRPSLRATRGRGEGHLGSRPCVPPRGRLVDEVKSILARDHASLPVGEYGRDDDAMLRWFLKDRKYKVEPTVEKLAKAIKWRHEFGVAGLTAADVAEEGATGKAFLHEYADVDGRPVIVVVAAKHFPDSSRLVYSQQLCAYLIERAIERLPEGEEQFRGIFDLRGFTAKNTDLAFVKFMIDVFFNYYPKRLHQVLFVDAPFIFQPGWKVMKPLLKSYANLVSAVVLW
ncbi:unnamed protein product [Closterium sp. Naga37s-1]|nr:unnamed protein product [Closterium sp. Naga37s-1]